MSTYRIGLIGDPVAHSRSPAIHNPAFAHLGIDAHYELWHTPADEVETRVASLRDPAVLGANVTLPHKAAVIPFLDALEQEAQQIGAVNTIYKRDNSVLVGANTDAPGLLADLRQSAHFDPQGQAVVILGASGAARAAIYALLNAGATQIVVVNRTLERAEMLLADVLETLEEQQSLLDPRLVALSLDDPDVATYSTTSALLINATSVGWHANETPLPGIQVAPGTLVYDMVYRPTRLLREAAACGARTLDGMGMLLHQGALAFERWTGHAAPLDVMRSAVREG